LIKKWEANNISIEKEIDQITYHMNETIKDEIVAPLTTVVKPPLMEEKSLLNQEELNDVTHDDHSMHYINSKDENLI